MKQATIMTVIISFFFVTAGLCVRSAWCYGWKILVYGLVLYYLVMFVLLCLGWDQLATMCWLCCLKWITHGRMASHLVAWSHVQQQQMSGCHLSWRLSSPYKLQTWQLWSRIFVLLQRGKWHQQRMHLPHDSSSELSAADRTQKHWRW